MKKLIVVAAVVYGVFAVSRMTPSAGFYVLLMPALAGLAFVWRHRRANAGRSRLDRVRTHEAVQAVRRGMSYAEASHKNGVPERAIRRHRLHVFHIYFD